MLVDHGQLSLVTVELDHDLEEALDQRLHDLVEEELVIHDLVEEELVIHDLEGLVDLVL